MIGAVAASLAGGVALRRVRPNLAPGAEVVGILGVAAPVPTAACSFLTVAARRWLRARRRTQEVAAEGVACREAGELVGLGLAGGLSIAGSIRLAATHAEPAARRALRGLLARVQRKGTELALVTEEGPTRPWAAVLGSAATTGAPALPALQAHLDTAAARHRQEKLEQLRRLPVRLLVPLALLVLPGFVLTVVGPVLIDALARLSL